MSERFWPAGDAAQAEYELLRAATLAGERPETLAAARFARRGLTGLIASSWSQPIYLGVLVGAERPAWCGASDPRETALSATYELLLASDPGPALAEVAVEIVGP